MLSLAARSEPEPEPEKLTIFLWVLHGASIASVSNLYPIKNKFKQATFYGQPFKILDSQLLHTFNLHTFVNPYPVNTPPFETNSELVYGNCPIIPIHTEANGTSISYFPPMVFMVDPDDATRPNILHPQSPFANLFGLYHITVLQQSNRCYVTQLNRVYNHTELVTRWGNTNQTYSVLFKLIYEYAKGIGISTQDCLLGLYNCQNIIPKYGPEYLGNDIRELLPTKQKMNTHDAHILDRYEPVRGKKLTLFQFDYDPADLPTTWKALATLRHQGCGLNILSFYGFITQTVAREKTTCLPITGSSIFNIINYMVEYYGFSSRYIVYRYTIEEGISQISSFFSSQIEDDVILNKVVIFKLYEDMYQRDFPDKLSQAGHIVSIRCITEIIDEKPVVKIFFVDPQSEILNYELSSVRPFDLQVIYGRHVPWKFMDIIYEFVKESLPIYSIDPAQLPRLTINPPLQVDEFSEIIGLGNYRKNRKMNKNKNTRKMNKNKNTRKNLTGGAKKTGDPFIDLMNKIDEESKTKSVLAHIEIKD